MQHVRFWLGLAAPLALLVSAPAVAQQAPDGASTNEAEQTRQLEGEIEDYPGPSDGVRDERASEVLIPEEIHPAPSQPSRMARPSAAPTASARANDAPGSVIDSREIQRVMGSDTRLISLASLDPASVTRLQVRLRDLGHYLGAVDGVPGPQTRAALEAYARAQFTLKQRLIRQAQLTLDLAEQLGVEPSASPMLRQPLERREIAPPQHPPSSLVPPGAAPLPAPDMLPQPTPSSAPPKTPPARPGRATPDLPPLVP